MTFAEIAAQLARVVEMAERAQQALRQASDDADDCKRLIAESTAGTTHDAEAAEVVANFAAASTGAADHAEALAMVLAGVERIRAALQVHTSAAEQSWAEQQRARLPAYITSGACTDPDGYTELVQSGREPDGERERINAHLIALGLASPNRIAEASKHDPLVV
jgi:uncharacterized protein YhaN